MSKVPQGAGSVLRREHLVAACLVGTVVVVVGFASGLGLRHPTTTAIAAPPQPTRPVPNAAGTAPAAGGSPGGLGSAPVNYVGTPAGGGPAAPVVPAASLGGAPVPSPTGVPPTSAPPPGTSTGPPVSPACQPGLLTAVLDQVTTVVNALPVVGSVLNGLTGSTPAPPAITSGGPTDGLTGSLLGGCPAGTPATGTPGPTPTPTGPGS